MGLGRIWHFLRWLFHQHHKKRMLRILHSPILYRQHNLYNHCSKQSRCVGSFSRPRSCCTRSSLRHLWQRNTSPTGMLCKKRPKFEAFDHRICPLDKHHRLNYRHWCSNQRCNLYNCFDHTCSLSPNRTVYRLCRWT